ncbi:ABC transporter ATP-binding protein [uncultured Anaerococcus sp.]|uniref:ABC transporter ATP-binding protein n=2 Tax=Anaerococcus TaxID=165779 RepID=UPI0025E7B438|nr:ABC transporter ATP-binding protein [uncultured Anaerococcus sp.]
MKELKAINLSSGYNNRIILKDINLSIPKGKISVIIGSNGCGKSTLLKTIANLIEIQNGRVTLDDKNIKDYKLKDLAKDLGLLPQSPILPESITVADLIARGRFPYRKSFKPLSNEDLSVINRAMEMTNITDLADRFVDELSGGQRQRVWIAMALAQDTDILLLDEPTTYLDIAYQVEVLDILTDLNIKYSTTIVMVLHDINLSCRYADYLFAIKNGKLIAEGKPENILNDKLIKDIYNMEAKIITDPVSKSPMIVPIGRHNNSQ